MAGCYCGTSQHSRLSFSSGSQLRNEVARLAATSLRRSRHRRTVCTTLRLRVATWGVSRLMKLQQRCTAGEGEAPLDRRPGAASQLTATCVFIKRLPARSVQGFVRAVVTYSGGWPARPSSAARACIARRQKPICSSSSTPSSEAPSTISSRLTPRANALSFIFLRTPATSTSWIEREGFTSVQAGQEARQLIAGKERTGQVRGARDACVERVAEDGGPHLLRPALLLEHTHTHPRVLLGRGMALVVEVVQQPCRCIALDQRLGRCTVEPKPLRLALAPGRYARFDAKRMLEQACRLGVLIEQRPGARPGDEVRFLSGLCHTPSTSVWFGIHRETLG